MNIFGTVLSEAGITGYTFFLCTLVALLCGFLIAFFYSLKNTCSKSFLITLVLLPAIVEMVIMLVNGNLGAGVAVAGAFSLVRFRSAAGKGQEITAVFLSMAVGLATGMGYLAIAVIFSLLISAISFALTASHFGNGNAAEQELRVTVPEDLDFENIFEEILDRYTQNHEVHEVKTTHMGSLYRISWRIVMKPGESAKAMIDEIRVRNGNLEVSVGRPVLPAETL